MLCEKLIEPGSDLASKLSAGAALPLEYAVDLGVEGAPVIAQGPQRLVLALGSAADGAEIRTVEGLADGETLHPLQRAFITHHALQCGFCTPGFLMLATAILENDPDIGDDELVEALASNLCRCTGYANILKAVKATAEELKASR